MKFPSRCRNCRHAEHLYICTIKYYEYGDESEPTYKCSCEEYIPSDNLEYLEYLYDKSHSKV
jgi:hypothetical protein